MNIFFSFALLAVFIFSLRFIDKSCWLKMKNGANEQEKEILKDMGYLKRK